MGIRHISSYLKQEGFIIDLLFCPQYADNLYSKKQIDSIISTIGDCDFVGISCSTEMSKQRVVQIVNELKKIKKRPFIVLGGHAATFTPEQALKYVDAVCIGEGEKPTLEIIKRLSSGTVNLTDISNVWFNWNGKILKNKIDIGPDLNIFPTVDYGLSGLQGDYYRINCFGNLIKITSPEESVTDIDRITTKLTDPFFNKRKSVLFFCSSRGCVSQCAYCQSPQYNKLCGGGKIKKRDVKLVIADLKKIISVHPNIGEVTFWDDDFFIRPINEIRYFAKEYFKKIHLPLFMYVSPKTMTEDKLASVAMAGNLTINMGVQSGSESVLKQIYNRVGQNNDLVIKGVTLLSKYVKKGLINPPWIDFIVNNPWATPLDIKKDICLVQKMPGPFDLHIHSLELLPNSLLFFRAVSEGKIKSDWDFSEKPLGLMATAEMQDFTEHIKELISGKHAYYTVFMYCLAGASSKFFQGSIRLDKISWLLKRPTLEKKQYIIKAFFKNHRVKHYLKERVDHGEKPKALKNNIKAILLQKFNSN